MSQDLRYDWQQEEVLKIYEQPFNDLLFQAQTIHRQHFDANAVQISSLFSIKTGNCPEDCKYCSQSARHNTDLKTENLVEIEKVIEAAEDAFARGATRFCMSAAWKKVSNRDMPYLIDVIKAVKALGLETCMTLGSLETEQSQELAKAGLDYYNHNLDTSREYYGEIITTRTYDERLETITNVRDAGIKVCCGGIIGLGEKRKDRVALLQQLANLSPHPDSIPINMLVPIQGTPLAQTEPVDPIDFIRTIATARILMPHSYVRLSAGRDSMSDEVQALAFLAGANAIFYGSQLLTVGNSPIARDQVLLNKLKIATRHHCFG